MDTTKCLAYFLNHYLAAAGTTTSSLSHLSKHHQHSYNIAATLSNFDNNS